MKNRPASSRPRRVGAVGEVVAAAQQPGAVVGVGVREPDVGVHRHQRAVLPWRSKSGSLNSVPPDSGAPSRRSRPMRVSCSLEAGAVPGLDVHVDPAGDEVGAAGHPGGPRVVAAARPTRSRSSVGAVLGLEVGGAVLEPEQVARRGLAGRRRRGAAEAELGPAHGDRAEADPGEVADRVHRDLRVVGAGLHAQVAVAARRVEVVGREVRQLAQRGRLAAREPEAVLAVLLEQRRAEAEGQR